VINFIQENVQPEKPANEHRHFGFFCNLQWTTV